MGNTSFLLAFIQDLNNSSKKFKPFEIKLILKCNTLLSNQFISKPITQKYSKLNKRFGEAAHMSAFPCEN
jgi:hypothetical protein